MAQVTVSYKMLKFSCQCSNVPSGVFVGTTSDYNLVAKWFCPKCETYNVALMSLEKLIAGVPEPPSVPATFDEKDVSLLKDMHIQLEHQEGS